MIMKKRMIGMMMAVIMSAAMVGCGASGSEASEQSSASASHSTVDNNKASGAETSEQSSASANQSTTDNPVKTFSEVVKEGDYSIWFGVNDVDKWNIPYVTVFYKDGTCITIYSNGKRLGDYAQMTDEEIVNYVEAEWKSGKDSNAQNSIKDEYNSTAAQLGYGFYGNYYLTQDTETLQDDLKPVFREYAELYVYGADQEIYEEYELIYGSFMFDWVNEHPEQAQKFLEEGTEPDWNEMGEAYIAAASAVCGETFAELDSNREETAYDKNTYSISVWTDASGNKVEKEMVSFISPDSSSSGNWELRGYVGAQPIYDAYYGGYVKNNDTICVTRTSSNGRFEFDAIGTEGIAVDSYGFTLDSSDAAAAEATID